MYDIEMIKIDAALQKDPCVLMLPDSIPGATVYLRTLEAGETIAFAPEKDKAQIFLSIDGKFSFAAGEVKTDVEGRWVFIPSALQNAEFAIAEKTRILQIIWEIPADDRAAWAEPDPEKKFPYIQEYITSLQYRDRNKSDKTISREMVRQRIVPGFCMGSVESYGYDKVAQHPHPMLDQFFFSFPENDVDVLIDDFKVPMKGDTLLHIPLGSNHGVEVLGDNHMHYIWIDFFLGQAGLDRLDSSHKHTGTMRNFDNK